MSDEQVNETEMFRIGKAMRGGELPKGRRWLHKNRLICLALRKVHTEGQPMSLIAVAEKLRSKGMLEHIGGYPYLTECWEMAGE